MKPSSKKPNAFSTVEDQIEALRKWKEVSEERGRKGVAIASKITSQKKNSENIKKKRAWLLEREKLYLEEEELQDLYDMALRNVSIWRDVIHETSPSEGTLDFKLHFRDRLHHLSSQVHSCSAADRQDEIRKEMNELKREVVQQREREVENLKQLESEEVECLKKDRVDVELLFTQCEERFNRLRDSCLADSNLVSIFGVALDNEKRLALQKLVDCRAPPYTLPENVLSCAALALKMTSKMKGHQRSTNADLAGRVKASFPQLTMAQAQLAIDEAAALRTEHILIKSIAIDYRRSTQSMLSAFEDALQTAENMKSLQRALAEDALEQKDRQEKMHQALEEQRELYRMKVQLEQQERDKQAVKEGKRQEALKEKRLQEFQERLEKLQMYEEKQKMMKQKEEELRQVKEREDELQKLLRMEKNVKRVQFRKDEYAARQQERTQREEELAEMEKQKQDALKRFFASVEESIGVEADPQRILQGTASSEQKPTDTEISAMTVYGYTDDQVMKDPRVRLFHALLEAGLHKGPYAREVMSRGYHVPPAQQMSEMNPFL
ncbi:coiled-coil domain containing 148 [Strigomonas culicis]|uniref:Coiled-coil domain containing 148 n=1 Tax=Strigomonas culicis TaxID=28005 RepID=S9V0M5_9TRYP|nr:coiled-coil domain containing 148 [Strigomonas culicis]|eukprot:EPY20466.1 coiled-coil domain containing 148 [Strigomonas culicis]